MYNHKNKFCLDLFLLLTMLIQQVDSRAAARLDWETESGSSGLLLLLTTSSSSSCSSFSFSWLSLMCSSRSTLLLLLLATVLLEEAEAEAEAEAVGEEEESGLMAQHHSLLKASSLAWSQKVFVCTWKKQISMHVVKCVSKQVEDSCKQTARNAIDTQL